MQQLGQHPLGRQRTGLQCLKPPGLIARKQKKLLQTTIKPQQNKAKEGNNLQIRKSERPASSEETLRCVSGGREADGGSDAGFCRHGCSAEEAWWAVEVGTPRLLHLSRCLYSQTFNEADPASWLAWKSHGSSLLSWCHY